MSLPSDKEGRPLAVVLGAGVSGLSCAVRLLETGWDVHVVSRERPAETVSVGAGAIWEFPPARSLPALRVVAARLTHRRRSTR